MIEILAIIKRKNQFVYLMGDYNVNLLNLDKNLLTSECLEMFYSYSFYPLINKPTRVTYQTASLIDNITILEIIIICKVEFYLMT